MTADPSAHHGPHHAKLFSDDGTPKFTNALANETSPYLRQHAHNPVDWHPWGPEAFALAQQQQKPIFLSIGYATCYWCHVMERQVFESPDIAAVMNEYFINIKVDREERPDVDDLYMSATQLLTQGGGWPMSVFLTPPPEVAQEKLQEGDAMSRGLLPFWAGTYIPPEASYGRPGFVQLASGIHEAWETRPDAVRSQARSIADAVHEQLAHTRNDAPVDFAWTGGAAEQFMRMYDRQNAGFSGAAGPKFPTPNHVALLLAASEHEQGDQIAQAVQHTLGRMARGGMFDQVGGGFHRYSTDERWLVPHFEKMLYDNGQLLGLYAEALRRWPQAEDAALYRRVIAETAGYLEREMKDDTGAFWSAQDAEVNGLEGGNYVWTAAQVRGVFQDEPALLELALAMYGLDHGTNFTDPHVEGAEPVNVLFLPEPLAGLAAQKKLSLDDLLAQRERINARLLVARDRRPQPATDDKVLTAWNGMAVAGLAQAARALDEPAYARAAARVAAAVVEHLGDGGGGLRRTMRGGEAKIPGFLEDYAFFIHGLIELHRAETAGLLGEKNAGRWLALARELTAQVGRRFAAQGGGYYDTLAGQSDLFVRSRSGYDGAIPTGNSQMAHNLVDLFELTGDEAYARRAAQDMRSWSAGLRQGAGLAHMQHALLRWRASGPTWFAEALQAPGEAAQAGTESPPVVTATVEAEDASAGRFVVTVKIAERFHLNANPASMPGLVPLTLEPGEVVYPAGKTLEVAFADEVLSVYEGEVRLSVVLDPGALPTALRLTVQACDAQRCLPPEVLVLEMPGG